MAFIAIKKEKEMLHEEMFGFTLIELMITVGIAALLTGLLVANFSRTRVDLNRAAATISDGIREAQSLALTGATVRGNAVCGYGIHFVADGFLIFAEGKATTTNCTTQNRVYDVGDDTVRSVSLGNSSLEIVLPADDIFFEPPDPTTFLQGVYSASAETSIRVRRKGAGCIPGESSPDCRSILVTGAGRIQAQ